jgi:2-hydroxychromene-2-carboxylate isomerase
MPAPIDFYFEFSSPYGYIASRLVEDVAKKVGREVSWRPMLLGPVFKLTGSAALVDIPMKGDYARHDFVRSARYHGVPFTMPKPFPIGTVAALRTFYWLDAKDPALAREFAKKAFTAFYVDGRDISSPAVVVEIARALGVDAEALSTALADPAVKELAKSKADAAIAAGVFGSPYFVVDGEPFWGVDRLPMLEDWVKRGGW